MTLTYGPGAPAQVTGGTFRGCCIVLAQVTQLDLNGATPGARVDFLDQTLGLVGDDGAFSLTTPFSLSTTPYGRVWAYFRVGFTWDPLYPGSATRAMPFHLLGLTVTGVQAPPAPEPETWVLLIGGLGLAGAQLRRRRAFAA